jgi:hypothetical protein
MHLCLVGNLLEYYTIEIMNRILLLLLLLVGYANAQTWQPTSIRQRFVNGIGIPTRDTVTGTAADSSQFVLRPQDSVIYYKYKGYWRKVGTGAITSIAWDSITGKPVNFPTTYALSNDVKDSIQSRVTNITRIPGKDSIIFYTGTNRYAIKDSIGTGTVTSVGLSMPSAFTVSSSPITTSGTIAVTGAGNATQYVRGDGTLATLPTNGGGGGASVSYYLNGSVNQGTFGGNTYYEMNKTPIIGAGTDFSRSSNGYIASFLTDAGDPALLNIPAGNWNFETYFQASSGGGSPTFYIELYKYDGTTFTLIASNSGSPKLINDGTNIEAYFSALAVPQTTLTLTDRLAVRIYVTTAGRTITLHTENGHLCQVITTFTTGLTALNGLTSQVQYLAVGTSGTDFNISSATDTHTFNLPTASATNRGALSAADWTMFNNKQNALTNPVTGTGTTNYIPKWTGTSSQSNSLLFDNGTNVGISNASPSYRLDVNGTARVSSTLNLGSFINLTTANAFGLNYLTFQANTASNGVSASFLPNGNPSGYGYNFQFSTSTTSSNNSSLLIIGGNSLAGTGATNKHVIAVDNGAVTSRPLIFKVAPTNTGWGATNEQMTLFGTGNLVLQNSAATATDDGSNRLQVNGNAKFTGNVGIGTASPSAWSTTYKAVDLGDNFAFLGGAGASDLYSNLYLNTSSQFIYKTTGAAAAYSLATGAHRWYTVPSGTAGNVATLTQVMTLTNTGNVGIGTATPTALLHLSGNSTSPITHIIENNNAATSAGAKLSLRYNGTETGYLYNRFDDISGFFNTDLLSNGYLRILTNSTERLRITSTGNTLIGGNTDDGINKLQVTGSIKSTSLAGTGERLVTADANGKLLAGTGTFTAISGTYTPTYTAIANTAATGAYTLSYTVVGNVVTIFGRVNINSSTPNSVTTVDMTTPTAVQYITSGSVGGAGTEIATDGSRTQATLGFIESPVNTPINLIRIVCKPMTSGNLIQYRFTVSYLIDTSL